MSRVTTPPRPHAVAAASFVALAILACGGHREAPVTAETGGARAPVFTVVPLGVAGGLLENDLSAYLLAARGGDRLVAFDAGTLRAGLEVAAARGVFAAGGPVDVGVPPAMEDVAGWVLRERVGAYLISHAHLDHYAGLVLNSPDDGPAAVLGLGATIDALRDHLFNGTVWANFADEGAEPRLARYRYARLVPGEERPLGDTGWTVEAHPLAHAGVTSTAFLVRSGDAAIVYLGDTGPDAVEDSDALERLWRRLAPLVRSGALRAVLVEVSFPSGHPDDRLFGHLTPRWLAAELRRLAALVATDGDRALAGLPVVVTHVKPLAGETFATSRERIRRELAAVDAAGARFVFPVQGVPLGF